MKIKRDFYLDRLIEVESRDGGKREKKQLEIDFVVNTGSGKTYIQSAYRLAGADKIEQETRGLRKIGDSFRKIVVVDGVQPFYTDESGVSFVSLMDFMLNRNILG